jgi:hypothetical protein
MINMSTKTLRNRIALVAVSALGAGILSVLAVPSSNAASKDGVIDSFEKKMTRLINLAMFLFFILINSSLIYFALSYS